ncbi:MAG: DUF2064 domain-containing protein [Rhodospirillales bacterium]|nr:DUF2064 domain-containing protein [Rhodospirillales bacterium]
MALSSEKFLKVAMGEGPIAFGIICEAPAEAAGDPRLCPPLTTREAAELARCFVADISVVIAGLVKRGQAEGVIVYAPAGQAATFTGLVPPELTLRAQRGETLEQRWLNTMRDLQAAGHPAVCLLQADSPTLPLSLLEWTIASLRQPGERVVLGPAIDGSCYLIGLKQAPASVLPDIAWTPGEGLRQMLVRTAALGVPVTLLPVWYGVRDIASLQLLLHELFSASMPLAAEGVVGSPAEHTRRHLAQLLSEQAAARFEVRVPPLVLAS